MGRGWIQMGLRRTTGTSLNRRGTIGPKNWTAGPGLKIGDLQNKTLKYTDISDITNT